MTDSKFKILLERLHKANSKYRGLLEEAEEEYERRFGNNPSDIDDDNWIDCFHGIPGYDSFEKVIGEAERRNLMIK